MCSLTRNRLSHIFYLIIMFFEFTDTPQIEEVLYMNDESIDQFLNEQGDICLLYTSPSPRDATLSRMPSSA